LNKENKVLKATQKIIELNKSPESDCYRDYLINIINENGTLEDARALFVKFRETRNAELLYPIMFHGDEELSEDLFNLSIINKKLIEGFPEDVFDTLSYLGNPKLEEVLINYFDKMFDEEGPEHTGWGFDTSVCLSLLNYSCNGYEDLISKQIEKCLPEWIFPELIPCLAIKTKNKDWFNVLYDKGSNISIDYNSGLILGLSLFGMEKRDIFKSIIWNERWEIRFGDTNSFYAYLGMNYLRISISELFKDLLNDYDTVADNEIIEYKIWVIYKILERKIYEPYKFSIKMINKLNESYVSIYNSLFKWRDPNKDESIIGIYKDYLKLDNITNKLYELKSLVELRIEKEIEEKYNNKNYT
jgi:hypothetical protein